MLQSSLNVTIVRTIKMGNVDKLESIEKNRPEMFELLARIGMPQDQFAVFGSGPMFLHGIRSPNELQDLDLIAVGEAWDKAIEYQVMRLHKPVKQNGDWGCFYVSMFEGLLEVWNGWGPGTWDLQDLIDRAEVSDSGIRFVRLEDVVRWKNLMRRPKDIEHSALIRKYLSERES